MFDFSVRRIAPSAVAALVAMLLVAPALHAGSGALRDGRIATLTTEGDPVALSPAQFENVPELSKTDPVLAGEPSAPRRGNQIQGGAPIPGATDLAFEGFGFDDNITENSGFVFIPPDPIGAAGPEAVVAVVNTMVEIRTKGGHLVAREGLRTFFAPVSPLTFTFDPKIVYDHYAGRFVIVTLEQVTGAATIDPGNISKFFLAVSKNSNPRSLTTDDWWFHAIDAKTIIAAPAPPRERWADYPGFEIDEEAIYITANMYSFVPFGLFGGVRLWIVDKGLGSGGFYDGGAASVTKHDPYAGGGIATTTMPALVFGAGGVGGAGSSLGTFLVSYSGLSDGVDEYVQVVTVDDPLGTPTFTQEFVLIGNIENFPPGGLLDAPQLGTSTLIEVNDRRALDATWRDDRLWLTTTIRPNAGPDLDQTTAHWWKLDTSAGPGAITLDDQGDIGGEDIAPGTSTFFPSVAVNSDGDAKFGFSASAASIYAGAYVTGRRDLAPAGTVEASDVVHAGEDSYVRTFGGPRNRWGDYSGISLDPTNDRFFWVFNQYADERGTPTGPPTAREDGRWGTAWVRCKFLGSRNQRGDVVTAMPSAGLVLEQNHPNPFNPTTTIEYRLPSEGFVSVDVLNVRGQIVRSLFEGRAPSGSHTLVWDGRDASGTAVPSGTYFYRVQGLGAAQSKKMILLK
jgi:hypothetical protein